MAVLQKIDNPYGMIQTVEHCESFSIYRSQDSTGDCKVTVYPVFSGIELVYYDVHMQSCDINLAKGREMLIITHCQEGRIEFEYKNGEYLYLASGDLSIQKNTENIRHRYCPLSHYHGVSVAIDMNRVPRCRTQLCVKISALSIFFRNSIPFPKISERVITRLRCLNFFCF